MFWREIVWVVALFLLPSLYIKFRDYLDLKDRVVVQWFKPPNDLSVLELGFFLDNKLLFKDMLAWMVDLHIKGFGSIQKIEGGDGLCFVPDSKLQNVNFSKLELEVWNNLFGEKDKVSLNWILKNYLLNLVTIVVKFYDELVEKDYFKKRKTSSYLIAFIFAIVCFLIWNVSFSILNLIIFLVAPFLSVWVILNSPQRTEKGKDLYAKLIGFRRYIEIAEKDRKLFEQKYINDTNNDSSVRLINVMPYLIVLNIGKEWIKTVDSDLQDLVGKEEILGLFSVYNTKDI